MRISFNKVVTAVVCIGFLSAAVNAKEKKTIPEKKSEKIEENKKITEENKNPAEIIEGNEEENPGKNNSGAEKEISDAENSEAEKNISVENEKSAAEGTVSGENDGNQEKSKNPANEKKSSKKKRKNPEKQTAEQEIHVAETEPLPQEIVDEMENLPEPGKVVFDLVKKYSEREEVVYWRNRLLTERQIKLLKNTIENSLEYRVYVRKCVRDGDYPAELEYLPVVESAYSPNAKSYSGAVGMWQFMSNSVGNYLKLNDYVDERLDPWKSTVAGLSKLQDNYKIFNDWLLAIAAYNCGNGGMKKAIKKSGEENPDFWTLCEKKCLPKQTMDYVPQLLAVAEICENPAAFEVEMNHHDKEFEENELFRECKYDTVETQKPYLMSALAKAFGVSERELKKLNPSVVKPFTPPATAFSLRLPLGAGDDAAEKLKEVKSLEFPFKYKICKGDSLWSLSRRYGVSIQSLCEINGITEKSIIKIGQTIYIPSIK